MALLETLTAIKIGTDLLSGFTSKKASNRAASRAAEAAEFNAKIIERDIDLLTRQRQIINANFAASQGRNRSALSATYKARLDLDMHTLGLILARVRPSRYYAKMRASLITNKKPKSLITRSHICRSMTLLRRQNYKPS